MSSNFIHQTYYFLHLPVSYCITKMMKFPFHANFDPLKYNFKVKSPLYNIKFMNIASYFQRC